MATKTRDERQFEKVMDQASKSDQQMVKMAERDAKRLEKEYLKSVKVGTQVSTVMTAQQKYISFQETQKAEKAMAKAAEKVTKCTKAMNKAEHSHKDVVAGREKAEKTLNVSNLGDHATMSSLRLVSRRRNRNRISMDRTCSRDKCNCSTCIQPTIRMRSAAGCITFSFVC